MLSHPEKLRLGGVYGIYSGRRPKRSFDSNIVARQAPVAETTTIDPALRAKALSPVDIRDGEVAKRFPSSIIDSMMD